jgi:hypothetical protein
MHSDEEVIRILAHVDPGTPDADSYVVVTLTRPRGSTEAVWKIFAAYGPMGLDKATTFLEALGYRNIQVQTRSKFPILDSLPIPPMRPN